jgi:hypothetical protein
MMIRVLRIWLSHSSIRPGALSKRATSHRKVLRGREAGQNAQFAGTGPRVIRVPPARFYNAGRAGLVDGVVCFCNQTL